MHNSRLSSALPVILALSITSSSCLFQKKPVTFTPPPPRTAPTVTAKQPTLADPPLIAGDPMAEIPQAPNSMPDVPPPPAPKPPPRKPSVAAPPKPAAATTAAPDTPAPPRLGQIFTPDQQREYNRSLDQSLEHVKRALAIVAGKSLNQEQNDIANKIRTFQKQAEEAREQDLLTAVELAKRADVLAQDLLERLP
jgi:hypothetical protein